MLPPLPRTAWRVVRSLSPVVVLAAFATPLAAQQPRAAARPTLPPELVEVRNHLDRYRDPVAAVHDGYMSTVGCMHYPEGGKEGDFTFGPGGMGIHFLNLSHIGGPLDPQKPQVLIYAPVGDSLQLAAAEWFVPYEAAGGQRPRIFGRDLDGPMPGHPPIMPPALRHYDLHVWLWKENPAGLYSPTNPNVSCEGYRYSYTEGGEGHRHH